MKLQTVLRFSIEPAFSLLPEHMRSPAAETMLLSIGLQESRFLHRRQVGGPARGFWQFELRGGTQGVLTHPLTSALAKDCMRKLQYDPTALVAHEAIEHNDVLAAVFARLLLWTVPAPLPTDAKTGWEQYIQAWRPGKPHRGTWDEFYSTAWEVVR